MAVEEITTDVLVQALEAAAHSFAPDELAYLALTSKVELPIRDRLAWVLHTALPGKIVAREWRRTDLAVLDSSGTVPLALIEAKALYSFDVASSAGRGTAYFPGLVSGDITKARKLSREIGQDPAVFALVFVTHPMGEPPNLPNIIKYVSAIRGSARYGSPAKVRDLAAKHLGQALERLGPVRNGQMDAGSAFGTPTAVDYWIVGPV
jgi:hypothetical protein